MEKILGRYEPYFYSLMRFIVGFLFMWHGTQKMLGFPAQQLKPGEAPRALDAIGATAGTIELVCGALIMVGLLTGFAAFLSSGLMAFAYFIAHGLKAFLPIQNGGEAAVLYCFVFLYIASRGSGLLSVDSLIFRGDERAQR